MRLIFCDRDERLREMFREEIAPLLGMTDEDIVADFNDIKGRDYMFATCSNPWFNAGAGWDKLLHDTFKDDWEWFKEMRYNGQDVGNLLFYVTVNSHLNAVAPWILMSVSDIIRKSWDSKKPIVFTGMGTGVGGLSNTNFINICKRAIQNL